MDFKEFLNFDEYVTPMVIKVVYAIGTLAYICLSLYYMPWGALFDGWIPFDAILMGILFWLLGLLVIRLNCELLMVIFKALQKVATRK